MENEKTGSCLCGGVQYKVHGPLRPVVACHCSQCRKTSGHYVAATQCAATQLEVFGTTLRWFRSSETAERGFCSVCGGNLFWREVSSSNISIMAGTLDLPTDLVMESQIHTKDKSDYYSIPPVPEIEQADLARTSGTEIDNNIVIK